MSTDVKDQGEGSPEAAPAADELKNFKAETSRKLTNQEATIAKLLQSQEQLMAQLAAAAAPKQSAPTQETLAELMYSNPAEYSRRIKEEAKNEISQQLAAERNMQARQQQVIASLANEFPEINNMDHPLTKRAIEIFNSFSKEEQSTPRAYSDAVKSAALEEGIRPKSKRTVDDADGFSVGASSSRPERKAKKDDLDPRTEAFARAVGLNLDDAKVKGRLMNKHGRKSYNNWE